MAQGKGRLTSTHDECLYCPRHDEILVCWREPLMHCRFAAAALAALALLTAGPPSHGQSREVAIEAGHRRFAEQYVAAARARDPVRYRKLVHPQSLGCITDENRDFFDDWMARAFRWKWEGPYRIAVVRALAKDGPPTMPASMGRYPVAPTHQIQIDLQMSATRAGSLLAEIAPVGTTWYQVLPCPTAEGLAAFRSTRQANAAQLAKAQSLAHGLAAPLRAELLGLLKEGKRIDAIRRFSVANGEDITTARRVIDVLEAEAK
jgi:hypothetical protein